MKILILTGNGALVGAQFYSDIIKELHFKHNKIYDVDYPEIVVYNLPLDINHKGELNNSDILQKKLIEFNNYNIDYLFVLCNSISNTIKELTMSTILNYKFISIIDSTAKSIKDNALILSSSYTNNNKLYGEDNTYLKEQYIVDNIINNILNGKENDSNLKELFNVIKQYGNNEIVLGCTELYFIKDYFYSNINKNIYCSLSIYKNNIIDIINK